MHEKKGTEREKGANWGTFCDRLVKVGTLLLEVFRKER